VWVLVLVILDACRVQPPQAATVSPGATPAQVRTLLGEPTRLQNFLLPEAPFFGPQESLTNLIPAGTPVEEWVYVQGNEELYVWFVCTQGSSEGECTVIESARYPVGAVY
jgi:hypothetical protein